MIESSEHPEKRWKLRNWKASKVFAGRERLKFWYKLFLLSPLKISKTNQLHQEKLKLINYFSTHKVEFFQLKMAMLRCFSMTPIKRKKESFIFNDISTHSKSSLLIAKSGRQTLCNFGQMKEHTEECVYFSVSWTLSFKTWRA